jgi:hypothetical protein
MARVRIETKLRGRKVLEQEEGIRRSSHDVVASIHDEYGLLDRLKTGQA